MTLNELSVGQTAVILKISATSLMQRRLQDIGFVKNTKLECVGKSPLGDPTAFLIKGTVIALREEECKKIFINCC